MAPAPPPPPAQQTRSSARLRSSVAPSQPSSTRPSSSTAVRQTASSQAKQAAAIKDRLEREAARASVAGRTTGASGGNSPTARGTVGRGTFGSARVGTTTASAMGARVRASVVPPSSTAPPKPTLVAKKREMPSFSALPRGNPPPTIVPSFSSSNSSTVGFKGRFLNAANSVRKMGLGGGGALVGRLAGGGGVVGGMTSTTGEAEQIKSFLRIRPRPTALDETHQSEPYLAATSTTEVVMTSPADSARPHWSTTHGLLAPRTSQAYAFTRVFEPETDQKEFFEETAGPLVKNVLNGENGLVFAYGVTNAGKTYTIQGTSSERGIIPRSLSLLFKSLTDVHSPKYLKAVRNGRVEVVRKSEEDSLAGSSVKARTEGDENTYEQIKVDRNFEYAVFVSYVELYNEKIFDLLENLPSSGSSTVPASSTSLHDLLHPSSSSKRRPLALKNDTDLGIKYVSGMREVRVRNEQEALKVVEKGMEARQVWGTRMNEKSSRSHAVFTVKVVRIHGGAPDDPHSTQVSRMSIVDLAGSERTKNTGNTGDRLKEAGSINKSLMVLGQCMEVLTANQKRVAAGRKPALVPFRHSKLTEMFQGFFAGDGRAVMMIHVNPYDTGFDENSHVMKFSAVAREIQTTTMAAAARTGVLKAVEGGLVGEKGSGGFVRKGIPEEMREKRAEKAEAEKEEVLEVKEQLSARASEIERERVEKELLNVLETVPAVKVVAEADDEFEEDDDEPDALVEYLFEVIKDLRVKVLEAEIRCATIESDTRDEMAEDMSRQIQEMEQAFSDRMRLGSEQNTMLRDRQIDIVQRSAMKPRPQRFQPPMESDEDEDEGESQSLVASPLASGDVSYDELASPTPALSSTIRAIPFSLPPSKLPFSVEPGDATFETASVISEAATFDEDVKSTEPVAEIEEDTEDPIDMDASVGSHAATQEEDELDESLDQSVDVIDIRDKSNNEDNVDEEENEEEEEEEEEDEGDSSFDASAASFASPSPTPTPEPSPSKARSAKKSATRLSPVKKAPQSSSKKGRAADDDNDDDNELGSDDEDVAGGERAKVPLRESVGAQDTSIKSAEPLKKKKRKLGGKGKMMTEDDMAALQYKSTPIAEIKRFARTSGASLY